jgi:hypothetical protein
MSTSTEGAPVQVALTILFENKRSLVAGLPVPQLEIEPKQVLDPWVVKYRQGGSYRKRWHIWVVTLLWLGE